MIGLNIIGRARGLFCAVAGVMCVSLVTGAHAQKLKTPNYLKYARAVLFMANEIVKNCPEIKEDAPVVRRFLADLKKKLADDGITNVKSQLEPVSMSEIIAIVNRMKARNGGAFGFNKDKYCAFGRKEIKQRSYIGRLLKVSGS